MIPEKSPGGFQIRRLPEAYMLFFPFVRWWPAKTEIFYRDEEQFQGLHTAARIRRAEIHAGEIKKLGWREFLHFWIFSRKYRQKIMIRVQTDELEYTHPILMFDLKKNFSKEKCRISDLFK
jgi:hypothetical protein